MLSTSTTGESTVTDQQRKPSFWSAVAMPRDSAPDQSMKVGTGQAYILALFGETGGTLPQYAGDDRGSAVFDGLLYNHDALRKQLDLPEDVNSAEVLLNGYRRWGNNVFAKLRGIFALALQEENRIFLVRDALGVYPLFYSLTQGVFGTSIAHILQQPNANAALNYTALGNHLRHSWPDPAETFYEDIRRVMPGHVVSLVENRQVDTFRYWDPAPPDTDVNWVKEDELGLFDELLDQAVSRYIELGTTGIFLSGGLDSVTVGAAATLLSDKKGMPKPWALSLVFPDPECNEEVVQRNVADGLGLPIFITSFDSAAGDKGLLPAAIELSAQLDLPLLNTWLPTYQHLGMQGKQRGCDVILTGNGGDEWLSVGPFYAADLLLKGDFRGLSRLFNNVGRSYHASRFDTLRGTLWTFGMRPILGRTARNMLNTVSPDYMTAIRSRRRDERTPEWLAPDGSLRHLMDTRKSSIPNDTNEISSFYLREMRVALDHLLIAWDMEEVFQVSHQLGTRILHPLWDAELVDLLYRIPPELLNQGGRSKGMVRQSLARRFPNLGFDRQKKVTSTNFFQTIMLEQGKHAWEMMGGTSALADMGIVEPELLQSHIFNILENPQMRRQAHRIWDVLNLEAWVRAHA